MFANHQSGIAHYRANLQDEAEDAFKAVIDAEADAPLGQSSHKLLKQVKTCVPTDQTKEQAVMTFLPCLNAAQEEGSGEQGDRPMAQRRRTARGTKLTLSLNLILRYTHDETENIVVQLNEYLQAMTEDVFRSDGTSDKFLGDVVIVFWSAPIEQQNHAQAGLRYALAMGKQMKATNKKSAAEWKEPFTPQVGLHTGEPLLLRIWARKV